jgi:signal peptidase II
MLVFIYIIFFTILIILDQFSKKSALNLSANIDLTEFFSLNLSFNKGISFGIFNHEGQSQIILLAINFFIIIGLLYYFYYNKDILSKTSIILIISGAIGNSLDRIYYGFVIDFLHFHYRNFSFPIFNFADIFIVLGGTLLLLCDFLKKGKTSTNNY